MESAAEAGNEAGVSGAVVASEVPKSMEQARSQAQFCHELGFPAAAREACDVWLDLARREGAQDEEVGALTLQGSAHVLKGDYRGAVAPLLEAEKLARKLGRNGKLPRIATNLGRVYHRLGDLLKAQEYGREAVAGCRAEPGTAGRAEALLVLSQAQAGLQHWPEALATARDALQAALDRRNRGAVVEALNHLGHVSLQCGDEQGALNHLREAYRTCSRSGSYRVAYSLAELGWALFQGGQLEEALQAANRALATLFFSLEALDRGEVARVCELYGALLWSHGDNEGALRQLNRAARYYGHLGMMREQARVVDRVFEVKSKSSDGPGLAPGPARQTMGLLSGVLDMTDDLEAADPHLYGHSEMVAVYAAALGRQAGLDRRELALLKQAARLHDVGMAKVNPAILTKQGELTPSEREAVEAHCLEGGKLLAKYRLAPEVLEAVRHHHEHYDGQGYPNRRAGEDIPLFSRIIAVADCYDALVNQRSFREAFKHTQAIETIAQEAGTKLCPHAVKAFVSLVKPRKESILPPANA